MMSDPYLQLKTESGDYAPLGKLLNEAADFGIVTPDLNTISELSRNTTLFARSLRDQPSFKLLLLALRVESAKLTKFAGDLAVQGEGSNEELRALLTQQKTIDNIIRYVTQIQGSFESGGGIK